MPAFIPRIDPHKPIPPFLSRYPKRSLEELQQLMKKSRQAASSSTTVLRQAAQIATLVKKKKSSSITSNEEDQEEEPWITKYSNDSPSFSAAASRRRSAAVAAAAAISAASGRHELWLLDATGGHCNTNHAIPWMIDGSTGKPDIESNRVRELLRNRYNRTVSEQPESRADEKWDKARTPGGRRRRIVRDADAPEAPAEPPPSGYTAFLFLMTTKFRHDRGPEAEHSQPVVMQEISRTWRLELKTTEQQHYTQMAEELRVEYQERMLEYRATDQFRPSLRFMKLGDGQGPWVHRDPSERNALEQEVASYETVVFPPRPPSKDEAYFERERLSRERRKAKMRAESEQRQARKRALEETLGKRILRTGPTNRRKTASK